MSIGELQVEANNDPVAIVGEAEAGRAAKVKRQIQNLVKNVSASTFDLAELLWEVKNKNYYTEWGFESFSKYCKDIKGLKYSKSYYLVAIVSLMKAAGVDRANYEPVGLTKLRSISVLNKELEKEFNGIPMPLVVNQLTLKAEGMTAEEVQYEVDTILGLTEDESMVWLNVHVKKVARENVIKPALALMKKHMGSTGPDEEGMYHDPSDGAALEMMAANTLADPNYNVEAGAEGTVDPATGYLPDVPMPDIDQQ
jgi:hypothetical protein